MSLVSAVFIRSPLAVFNCILAVLACLGWTSREIRQHAYCMFGSAWRRVEFCVSWGRDPGHRLIAVKGSLQFLYRRVTFTSVKAVQPCKMLTARVRARAGLCGCLLVIYLFIYLYLDLIWTPWMLEAVIRDARTAVCGLLFLPSPWPYIQLEVDRWMKRQRLAPILSWRGGRSGVR